MRPFTLRPRLLPLNSAQIQPHQLIMHKLPQVPRQIVMPINQWRLLQQPPHHIQSLLWCVRLFLWMQRQWQPQAGGEGGHHDTHHKTDTPGPA